MRKDTSTLPIVKRSLAYKIIYKFGRPLQLFMSRKIAHCFKFYINHGYWPRLRSPRSMNERILHRIWSDQHSQAAIVADKLAVRGYVQNKISKDILIPLYWSGNNPENIPFSELPGQYVIKANHGSGWLRIITDKSKIDQKEIVDECKRWLSLKHSSRWNEKHYDDIKPMILIEQYIKDKVYDLPLDYKFFCFHGKVEYLHIDADRYSDHKRDILDTQWNRLPFNILYPNINRPITKPENLDRMIEIAQQLSSGFDFCRIDLYCQNGRHIYFGEITLTPGAALDPYYPVEWDFRIGDLWKK